MLLKYFKIHWKWNSDCKINSCQSNLRDLISIILSPNISKEILTKDNQDKSEVNYNISKEWHTQFWQTYTKMLFFGLFSCWNLTGFFFLYFRGLQSTSRLQRNMRAFSRHTLSAGSAAGTGFMCKCTNPSS